MVNKKKTLTKAELFQIGIEAISGSGVKGDIAIDDVVFTPIPCSSAKTTPTPSGGVRKLFCDFEDPKICG